MCRNKSFKSRSVNNPGKTGTIFFSENDLLESVMRTTDVMLVYLDADFNFIWVNSAYANACKMKPEEMIGKNHFKLYPHPENKDIFQRVRDTGKEVFFKDKPFIFPDQPERGVTYWDWSLIPFKNHDNKVSGLVYSLRETTQYKLAEIELRKTELEKSLILDNTAEIIAFHNIDHTLRWANKAYLKATGLSLKDIVGKRCYKVWGLHKLCLNCPVTKSIETGKAYSAKLTPQNQDHWDEAQGCWLVKASPVRDETGLIIGAIEVAQDITQTERIDRFKNSLVQISQLAHSSIDFDKIMNQILPEAALALRCETAAISLCLQGQWIVRYVYGFPKEVIDSQMRDEEELHAILAIKTGKPVAVEDTLTDKRVNKRHMIKWGIRSVLVIPFIYEEKVEGVLFFNYQSQPRVFGPDYLDFAKQLSSILTLALNNTRLFEKNNIKIYERKQTEKALCESQEDLNRAQTIGKIGSWRMNVQKNELTWSDESYRICGVPKDGTPLTYETFLGIVHPDDREYVNRKWIAALQGEPYDIEHRVLVEGKIKWVHEQAELEFDHKGGLLGGFGTCQDITERRQMEDELKKYSETLEERVRLRSAEIITERQRFFDVLETLPVMVCLLTPDYHIVFANKSFRDKFGESKGRHCYEYCFGKTKPCGFCQTYKVLESGKPHHWELKTSDGSIIEAHDFPFPDIDCTPLILKMDIDITGYRRAQQDLLDAQGEIERAKRLSDIGALATTVAHELRSPLGVIQGTVYNVKKKNKEEKLIKNMERIERKVAESEEIINNLLNYSRIKQPVLKNIHFYNFINECVDDIKRQNVNSKIEIIKDYESLIDISIRIDPFQIREVFMNVLNNAHDAIPAETGEIRITGDIDDEYIILSFDDNGPGIDRNIIDKIFDPFFTTKTKGTGLGLAVCRQILTLHDGEIGIKKGLMSGTCVFVRLPREGKNKLPPNEL